MLADPKKRVSILPSPVGHFFLDPSLLPYLSLATSSNLASVVIMSEKSRSKTVGIMMVNHVMMTTSSHGESNWEKRKTFGMVALAMELYRKILLHIVCTWKKI
jgi:hypothetical protein